MAENMKPIFDADAAEEYFTDLAVSYKNTANDIFRRDNEGRHASEQHYSAEYQKYVGMQIAMREVLEYFGKFELGGHNTNGDHFRAMSDEELVKIIGRNSLCDQIQHKDNSWCDKQLRCEGCMEEWLKQPAEEVAE